jgi:hypothetical protein
MGEEMTVNGDLAVSEEGGGDFTTGIASELLEKGGESLDGHEVV